MDVKLVDSCSKLLFKQVNDCRPLAGHTAERSRFPTSPPEWNTMPAEWSREKQLTALAADRRRGGGIPATLSLHLGLTQHWWRCKQ